MRTCQTWMETDEGAKKRSTPGRKGRDEGWISQIQLENETEKSTSGGAAGKVRREEKRNICARGPSTFSPEKEDESLLQVPGGRAIARILQ